jgi:hypothetical protein
MPAEIHWLGTTAWTFELGWDYWYWQPRSTWAAPGKAFGDTTQERTEEVRVQDIRSAAAAEGQAVRAMKKLGAEEVASGLGVELGNMQESSSAEFEIGVVVGNGIGRGKECAKAEEGVVAVE